MGGGIHTRGGFSEGESLKEISQEKETLPKKRLKLTDSEGAPEGCATETCLCLEQSKGERSQSEEGKTRGRATKA